MSVVITEEITIDAPRDVVWEVLADLERWGEWSNFTSAVGVVREGERLTMRMPGTTFKPTVTVAAPGRELRWGGVLGWKGLFAGQHSFALSTASDGTTRLTNREEFSGLLIALTRPLLERNHTNRNDNGYAAFNQGIKQRAEAIQAAARPAAEPLPAA